MLTIKPFAHVDSLDRNLLSHPICNPSQLLKGILQNHIPTVQFHKKPISLQQLKAFKNFHFGYKKCKIKKQLHLPATYIPLTRRRTLWD